MNIWHNTNGTANQYWVCDKKGCPLFRIPIWLGKILTFKRERGNK